ncbi:hypothetical protein GCM10011344_38710 [Dokdonia pacifica]|uniref:DUF6924 domain-containing protein n=1 Tax=Dokdonia pacifica TaxID=1627892 RepID=A0A239A0D3_9FLAO|nr:hypothetical protein [Dokdonia pacifica]GGG34212.1 hypothetical protein GCM10011344_38710 [Dokdonia pacifica]SNR88751.1 hypothetical protein SAMN06265376_10447 [Dokdonia pacifica]
MKRVILFLIVTVCFYSCNSHNDANNQSNKTASKNEMTKPNDTIIHLPDTKEVLVLRTDFSNDKQWDKICGLITQSVKELGFKPNVEFLSDTKYEGLKKERLLHRNKSYTHLYIFMIDSTTVNHNEHPILCIDLYDHPGESFRAIPSQMWNVENNLSNSNMDFEEFLNEADTDGIFRGLE